MVVVASVVLVLATVVVVVDVVVVVVDVVVGATVVLVVVVVVVDDVELVLVLVGSVDGGVTDAMSPLSVSASATNPWISCVERSMPHAFRQRTGTSTPPNARQRRMTCHRHRSAGC